MKKILVTGGSGEIGRNTIPFLRKEGYNIDNYDIAANFEDDIWDTERLTGRMKGEDVVIHLAAIPHPHMAGSKDYWLLNYEGTKTVFECAKRAAVKKFVFPSSGCVYGFWGNHAKPDKFPISEENYKPSIEEGLTIYGATKIACEEYLKEESEKAGIRTIALRLENVGTGVWRENIKDMYKGTCKLYHFFASVSSENYHQMLKLVIERDLDGFFEVFNVGDEYVHPSIDVQQMIRRYWPEVPNYTKGNEALYSIEKAKKLLGYKPGKPNIDIHRRIYQYSRRRLFKLVKLITGK